MKVNSKRKSNKLIIIPILIAAVSLVAKVSFNLGKTSSHGVIEPKSGAIDRFYEIGELIENNDIDKNQREILVEQRAILFKLFEVEVFVPFAMAYKVNENNFESTDALNSLYVSMLKFSDFAWGKIDFVVKNPSKEAYRELISGLYSEREQVNEFITKLEENKSSFGEENCKNVTNALKELLSIIENEKANLN